MDNKAPSDMYLGDGVYASYDGYHVVLDLRGQDTTTRIALDPKVIENLFTYCGQVGVYAEWLKDPQKRPVAE